MRRLLVVALGALVVLASACADEDAVSGASPTAVRTEVSASPTAGSAESPAFPPTVAPLGPAVGELVDLAFSQSDVRWSPYEPSEGGSSWVEKFYNVDDDAMWTLVGPNGEPYVVSLSPHGDQGIGSPLEALSSQDDGSAPTVLVDFDSGEVEQLLPFPVNIDEWPAPDLVHVRVGFIMGGVDQPQGWQRGLYELDLEAETMTLLQTGDRPVRRYPVPAGSSLRGDMLEVRPHPDDGWSSFHQVWDDDESQIATRLAQIVPSPQKDLFALVSVDNELRLFDPRVGYSWRLGTPAYWGEIRWSPNGRYLAATYSGLRGTHEVLIFDVGTRDLQADEVPFLGPYASAAVADWKPDSTELLLLNFSCTDLVFDLDRVELATGDRVHVPTDATGFWNYRWSPRGDVIAVTSRKLVIGLIDPVTGAVQPAPALYEAITTMQDFEWSATGRWLSVAEIGGRGRCE